MSRLRVLTGNTAGNPVARAVAKTRLRAMLLSAKLRIYTLDDGVDDSEYLAGLLNCLQVVARACALQWPGAKPSDVVADYAVLRGSLSALTQVLHRWDSTQAVAIEAGIDRAERLNLLLKTVHIYDAFLASLRDEQVARAELTSANG